MIRRSRLQSKTPLKQGKPLQRETPMPRTGGKVMERKATKRARPKPVASKPVADILKARSHGMCEIGLVCHGTAAATDSAHRMAKQAGGVGVKNRTSNRPANLVRACRDDHDLIDRRDVRGAEQLGLKIRHGVALPAEMPVYLHHSGWALLDDEGGVHPAPRVAWHREGPPLPVILVDCSDGWLDVPYEVLKRYKHDRCGGYEWDEQWLVTCKCGSDLFVALSDADPVEAAAERAFLAVEWAREVPW